MVLIQVLLPVFDNDSRLFPKSHYETMAAALTERFGGVTAYTRSPAEGHWKRGGQPTSRDEIVVMEIMCDDLDRAWWTDYRQHLETIFRQEAVIVRAQEMMLL
ncbi:hypothetical protein [Lichenihabitans psoromatis]|uniref:hypothetical protein n=1 Tax=Lichenihabitans psoromatis TaxID=2528642 RepID=UPI0010383626|nr:hypothetical protein [Lichenihabitans psoromatis]